MSITTSPRTLVPSPLRGTTEKLPRLRKMIAKRMHESLQSTAQLTTVVEADVTALAELRDAHKQHVLATTGVKLSFLPFFAKAAAEGLKVYPVINAILDLEGGSVTYPDGEHLGIAVDTEKGLFVAVVKNAADKSIEELAVAIDDLATRTRAGQVTPDEMTGGTFTVTNTGSRGALFDTPIVNSPQSAILGTGAVVRRPAAVRDEEGQETMALRSMVYLALSYDHRIIDGADAGRFVSAIKARLEEGAFEADLGL